MDLDIHLKGSNGMNVKEGLDTPLWIILSYSGLPGVLLTMGRAELKGFCRQQTHSMP